jgi:hypothetical protein
LAAAPVLWGTEPLAVAVEAEFEAWLPAAAVPEAEALALVRMPELAAAVELWDAAEALALALALAVALAPPLSSSAPSTTVAVMKATSVPERIAVCASSPVISAVQVIWTAFEL